MTKFLSFHLSILIIFGSTLDIDHSHFLSFLTPATTQNQEVIAEEKAISLAEEFIVKNGYTSLPPVEKKEITPELLDKLATFETIMKLRHNSLQPKAYGIIKSRRGGEGWTIVFLRTPGGNFDTKNGRGVSMTIDGKNLFMEPRDIILSTVDKTLQENKKEDKKEESK